MPKHNFLEITQYFNRLNQDQDHFYNSNDICTPMQCVKEMVDSLPESFWQKADLKILDPCCGNGKFIPLYYSEIVRNIVNKTINNNLLPKYKVLTSSYLHHYTKKHLFNNCQTEEFKYKIIHTPTQTVWSKKPHKYQDFHKVLLSLTNQYQVFTEYGSGITQSIAFIICKNLTESQDIAKELSNPVYKFLNNIARYGNFNNIRVLQNLPIFSSFELTNSENDFILEFNNKYYGEKEK